MKDRRTIDELTLDELEEIVRVRRREERIRRMREQPGELDPLKTPAPMLVAARSTSAAPARTGSRYSAVIESPERRRRGIRWDWVWDKFLLILEVIAFLGFVAVIVQLGLTMSAINEESRGQHVAPTPTPTPVIGVVVLPGGHTPPDAQGHSQPAPIPEHLQSLVAQITPLPVPTPGPEHAQRVIIPTIGVDAPVVAGDDPEALKKGAGHHIGSANPGERGNCVISAHNDIYGEIFRRLPEMNIGDEILVQTERQTFRYVVEQTRIVDPYEVSVMAPTSTPVLTLISCYPYGLNTHRIVVIASLQTR